MKISFLYVFMSCSHPIAGHHIPKGIKFHLIGLSDGDYKNNLGWPMKSLLSIRKALNHTSVCIFLNFNLKYCI